MLTRRRHSGWALMTLRAAYEQMSKEGSLGLGLCPVAQGDPLFNASQAR